MDRWTYVYVHVCVHHTSMHGTMHGWMESVFQQRCNEMCITQTASHQHQKHTQQSAAETTTKCTFTMSFESIGCDIEVTVTWQHRANAQVQLGETWNLLPTLKRHTHKHRQTQPNTDKHSQTARQTDRHTHISINPYLHLVLLALELLL